MRLPPEDCDLYFTLSTALLVHANQTLGVLPAVHSRETFVRAPLPGKVTLRDALYARPDLIDAFVTENPAGFSARELAEVESWKRAVPGTFYIVRVLKRYTVFLDAATPARAYGVLGLHAEIDTLFPDLQPPISVRTVLLPFRGRIVFDGIAQAQAIHFGPGIRATLNDRYQAAKETHGIVERLDTEGAASGQRKARRQPSPELGLALEQLTREIEQLHGGTLPAQRALALLRAAAHLTHVVVEGDDPMALEKAARRARTGLSRLEATLHRSASWGEAE